MALFTVSAGNNTKLKAAPAQAPASADSHGRRVRSSGCDKVSIGARRARRSDETYSFVENQAAVPPVSLMSVPVWPNHSPLNPELRKAVASTEIGPGSECGRSDDEGDTSICTCILHFTSSMGVLNESNELDGQAGQKQNSDAQQKTCYGSGTSSSKCQLGKGKLMRLWLVCYTSNKVL